MTYTHPYMQPDEQATVEKLLKDIFAAGHVITLWNGGDEPELNFADKVDALLPEMAASGEDLLVIFTTPAHSRLGSIELVYGNEPGVLISDHTNNAAIRGLVAGADLVAEGFQR